MHTLIALFIVSLLWLSPGADQGGGARRAAPGTGADHRQG